MQRNGGLFQGELARNLAATVSALVLVLALMCAGALWTTSELGDALERSARRTAPSQQALGSLLASVKAMQASGYAAQTAIVIGYMEKGSSHEGGCTACHDAAMVQKHGSAFASHAREARQQIALLRSWASQGRAAHLDAMQDALARWDGLQADYQRKAAAGDFDGAHLVLQDGIDPLLSGIEKTAAQLRDEGVQELSAEAAAGDQAGRTARWLTFSLCLISTLVIGYELFSEVRVVRNLRRCGASLSSVAGRLMKAASEMSASSQSLAAGVEQQGACLKQTAQLGLALKGQASSNSARSSEVAELVEQAAAATEEASAALSDLDRAMRTIDATSEKVASILAVMEEIASQTNLLALNASVEAARAGHAGLGFAVVAEEVRALAQRSADAAKETAALVEASRTHSADGRKHSARVGRVVEAISARTGEIQNLVRQVAANSQRQTSDLAAVQSSIEELERLAAQNERIAVASASGAAEVSGDGTELGAVVGEVDRMVGA